ncbi:MAG TPA: HD domain-containing protein [Bacteroidota bacterium]|nr:HD domain-containing protein [Bacteroidota bacterium]
MTGDNHIVSESRAYVERLLREKLAPWVSYHDFRHTEETAEACLEIAEACGLSPSEMEIVLLAGWFHDTGYTETAKGHEQRSAAITQEFLKGRHYPPEKLRSVTRCIMATMVPQQPKNLLERVVCDADMLYIGREEFFHKNDLLKAEMEAREGTVIDPAVWLRRSLRFLEDQAYHTDYCRGKLSAGLEKNITTLRKQLEASA